MLFLLHFCKFSFKIFFFQFCLEAMEESGGTGLDELIEKQADFFSVRINFFVDFF